MRKRSPTCSRGVVLVVMLVSVCFGGVSDTSHLAEAKKHDTKTAENRTVRKMTTSISIEERVDVADKHQNKEVPAKDKTIPVPPISKSNDSKRLVTYFCNAWKHGKFDVMYGCMAQAYRSSISLKEFKKLFMDDSTKTGGLKNVKIIETRHDLGHEIHFFVALSFVNNRTEVRDIIAKVRRTPSGWRILKSGILPVDLSKL